MHPPAPCGAGRSWWTVRRSLCHFNPPAPCGAGPFVAPIRAKFPDFNSPAPCGAGLWRFTRARSPWNFNPPAPCGAGLGAGRAFVVPIEISIHPPHAGRDNDPRGRATERRDFNPPAPCGAGLADYLDMTNHVQFQSTRPMRGGTTGKPSRGATGAFQSTRPVRGGTRRCWRTAESHCDFNPPAPCGAGLPYRGNNRCTRWISIHPPRAGRDCDQIAKPRRKPISIHPPRAGRDNNKPK